MREIIQRGSNTAVFQFVNLCIVLFVLCQAALAQNPEVERQNQLIQQLLQRIDKLESRVSELEGTRPVVAAVSREAGRDPEVTRAPSAGTPGPSEATGHDHGTPIQE